MQDVNGWLMALSFLLGLVLTFLFMIRRVTREVPVYAPLGRGPKAPLGKPVADLEKPEVQVQPVEAEVTEVEVTEAAAAAPAVAAAAAVAESESVVGKPEDGPYGTGSALPGEGGSGPAGWTIKGNMDSGLYHTPASPSYEQTIAEVWFCDEATAEAAGFEKYK